MKWMILGCGSKAGVALLDALLNEQRSIQQVSSAVGVAAKDNSHFSHDPRYTFLKCHFDSEEAWESVFDQISMYAPDIVVYCPQIEVQLCPGEDDWPHHERVYRASLLFPARLGLWVHQKKLKAKFIYVSGDKLMDSVIQKSYNSAMEGMKAFLEAFKPSKKDQFRVFELSVDDQMSLGLLDPKGSDAFKTNMQADARKLISSALSGSKNSFHQPV